MSVRIPIDRGVVIYKRGKLWWIDIHRDGTRERRSLGTADRNKALAIGRELATAIVGGKWNVVLASKTTLEQAVALYRNEYEPARHSESTRYYNGLILPKFVDFMNDRARPPVLLDSVQTKDIEAFQTLRATRITLHGKPVSPWTANRDIRELSIFFNWARARGLVRSNPCKGLRPLKIEKCIRRVLTPEECARLIGHLRPVLADLARLILNTGLRLGEATHLRVDDVDLKEKTLSIRSREDYRIKTRHERLVSLNPAALAVCARRIEAAGPSGLLFPTSNDTVLDNRGAERALHRSGRAAGVRLERAWYTLRHTFATNAAKMLPPFALASLLGNTVQVAERYYVHLRANEAAPPVLVT